MKQKMNFAQITRTMLLLSLIVCAGFTAARAQVIPRGCVAAINNQDGRVNLAADIPAGRGNQLVVNGFVPVGSSLTLNPGGANEQRVFYVTAVSGTSAPYTLTIDFDTFFAHQAGEPVQFELREYEVLLGYQNLGSNSISIQAGFPDNYFTPGPLRYPGQITTFLPGINENVFLLRAPLQRFSSTNSITWTLLAANINNRLTIDFNNPVRCATMTYQGRLSDGNTAANGEYDLRFTVFDALTNGTAQSSSVRIENAQVTNGIFTVPLNFGSALANNLKANFIEIAVRPGAASGSDPFTVLTPRQPITRVPYSVNAETATNVSGGIVQLPITTGAPPNTTAGGCGGSATQYGNMKIDATNNRIYVCTSAGWKSTVLQ